MIDSKCTSCGKSVSNDTSSSEFNCPACGKHKIVRCSDCRKRSTSYTCECSFEGP